MLRPFVLCLVLLAACAPAGPPTLRGATATPDRALLYQVGLTAIMSDGSLCVGHRPGRARDWTGQLSGCPYLLPYEVRNSNPSTPRLELRMGEIGTGASATIAGISFATP